MTRTIVVIGVSALVIGAALVLGGSRGGGATSIEDRAQAIASGLRCPVCQNLSVADSPSRLAGEMRAEITARLRAGASAEEIDTFFVQRYGEWVLLAPPKSGVNLIPWVVPILALAGGTIGWLVFVRRRPGSVDPANVPTGSAAEGSV
jgi:cytochrome c-type biogenesis protein CcmH